MINTKAGRGALQTMEFFVRLFMQSLLFRLLKNRLGQFNHVVFLIGVNATALCAAAAYELPSQETVFDYRMSMLGDGSLDATTVNEVFSLPGHSLLGSAMVSSVQNRNDYQEDRWSWLNTVIEPGGALAGKSVTLYGVYDGHGSHECSDFLKKHLLERIAVGLRTSDSSRESIARSIIAAYQAVDKQYRIEHIARPSVLVRGRLRNLALDVGSTAVTAIVIDNVLYSAHAGDARLILSMHGGEDFYATEDHAIAFDGDGVGNVETQRLLGLGYKINQKTGSLAMTTIGYNDGHSAAFDYALLDPDRRDALHAHTAYQYCIEHPAAGCLRTLQPTRTFGDNFFKALYGVPTFTEADAVTSNPTVSALSLTGEEDFMLLATDGLFEGDWDKNTNQYYTRMINALFAEEPLTCERLHEIANRVAVEALVKYGSKDNITLMLIPMNQRPAESVSGSGGSEAESAGLPDLALPVLESRSEEGAACGAGGAAAHPIGPR